MEKNKKGELGIKAIMVIVIAVILLLVVIVPTYVDAVDAGVTLECNDATLDTLNATTETCFNGTHMSVTATPDQTGITRTQETILLVVPTFFVLGVLFLVGKSMGLIGNKD